MSDSAGRPPADGDDRTPDQPPSTYTRAKLFREPGKRTDVALRFSTVAGGRTSATNGPCDVTGLVMTHCVPTERVAVADEANLAEV
ncbi:MAG: catalase [Solirubrobacterales bacterium]|nr:catalase [Solirubrobacterales bacterium]